MTAYRRLDPAVYQRVFEENREGQLVLEELVRIFHRHPYVPGGLEAQRETDYRAGQNKVIDHILTRINQANGVDDDETPEVGPA